MIRVMVNEAMRIVRENYLSTKPYKHSEERQGHANGYKPKALKTRMGQLSFAIQQVREGGFFLHALEKGMRSELARVLMMAESMYKGFPPRIMASIAPMFPHSITGVAPG